MAGFEVITEVEDKCRTTFAQRNVMDGNYEFLLLEPALGR